MEAAIRTEKTFCNVINNSSNVRKFLNTYDIPLNKLEHLIAGIIIHKQHGDDQKYKMFFIKRQQPF